MCMHDRIDTIVWLEKVIYEQIAVSEEIGVTYCTQQRARQFVSLTRLRETSGSESVTMSLGGVSSPLCV